MGDAAISASVGLPVETIDTGACVGFATIDAVDSSALTKSSQSSPSHSTASAGLVGASVGAALGTGEGRRVGAADGVLVGADETVGLTEYVGLTECVGASDVGACVTVGNTVVLGALVVPGRVGLVTGCAVAWRTPPDFLEGSTT